MCNLQFESCPQSENHCVHLVLTGMDVSMDAYASVCVFGADTKDSVLVWILLPLMVSALAWSNISAHSTWMTWVAQTGCQEPWGSTQFSLRRLCLPPDVNECVTNTHRCNLHAECLNTQGSFQCKCKQGYRGSGFDCAGEYHWMAGRVLCCFSPIIDHYKACSEKSHAEQCCNTSKARPLHKIIY